VWNNDEKDKTKRKFFTAEDAENGKAQQLEELLSL